MRQSWLLGLITSLESCKNIYWPKKIFLLLILCLILQLIDNSATARETFQFDIGDKIHVISDKAFRKTRTNSFEAVGNVIITHRDNAIYGEKATLSFGSGNIKVIGNVRYIGPSMTLYGSQLDYNFKSQLITVKNARVISDNYVILGQNISRISESVLTATDAEYSTCRDCPESWSIFGKKIHITLGEYIRIQHAYFKIKGVVVMYTPYLVLPIKKERQTGLLFPSIDFNFDGGVRYQQPWFWNIGKHNDMTVTPSFLGRRGLGGELQYRHIFGERTWVEVNSLQATDRIYEPHKKEKTISGHHEYRNFNEYEHNITMSNNFNHHLYYSSISDLDVIRDYNFFSSSRNLGSDIESGTFLNYRTSLMDATVEGYHNRNQLVENAREFDDSYVQILPKASVSFVPFHILHSDIPMLNDIAVGADVDYTVFRQHRKAELDFIRNARRYNISPYVALEMGSIGPVSFRNLTKWDYQSYDFPYESQKHFSKNGVVYQTEAIIEIDKVFGLSYKERFTVSEVDLDKMQKNKKRGKENNGNSVIDEQLIGEIPSFGSNSTQNSYTIIKDSYRHSQEFKIIHYFISGQKMSGNERFKDQINRDDGVGQFDFVDAIREREHKLRNQLSPSTTLPQSNTVELQWNNSLIQKKALSEDPFRGGAGLRDNFSYKRAGYFNLSQGYDLDIQSNRFNDKLTRLFAETGINFQQTSLSASEYYYHETQKHLMSFTFNQNFSRGSIGAKLQYDAFSIPVRKTVAVGGSIDIFTVFTLSTSYDYDMETKQSVENIYKIIFTPTNNCWKLGFRYAKTLIETKISFNFAINYSEKGFAEFGSF